MLGFEIGLWDYITFITVALVGVSFIIAFVWLAGLPGRIAIARQHPEAEAVKLLGWAGILPTIYPWIQALIWAFKPTNIIDIRRYPEAEAKAIEEQLARASGEAPPAVARSAEATPAGPAPKAARTATPDNTGPDGTQQ